MIQEEQLAENVVVLEAQRREVEAKIQSQEQTAMRYDIFGCSSGEQHYARELQSRTLVPLKWFAHLAR